MFRTFLSGDRKKYAATTAAHSKQIIKLFHNRIVLFYEIINIWENTNGCAETYRCATEIYLSSVLEHTYNIIIDSGVGAPRQDIEVVDGFNDN